jgi:hypothetical protein
MASDDALLVKILKSHDNYSMKIEYDVNQNPIYIGEAEPSKAITSQSIWRIKQITYDVNQNPTDICWAEGSREFKFIWDVRSTYTYS